MSKQDPPTFTVPRFAERVGVTRQAVQAMIVAGRIKARKRRCPAVKCGWYYEISRDELSKVSRTKGTAAQ